MKMKTIILFLIFILTQSRCFSQKVDSAFANQLSMKIMDKNQLELDRRMANKTYRYFYKSTLNVNSNFLINLFVVCNENAGNRVGKKFAHLSLERLLYLVNTKPSYYGSETKIVSYSLGSTNLFRKTQRKINQLCIGQIPLPSEADFHLIFSKIKSGECLDKIRRDLYREVEKSNDSWSVDNIRDLGILAKNGDSQALEKLNNIIGALTQAKDRSLLFNAVFQLEYVGGKVVADIIIDYLLFNDFEYSDFDDHFSYFGLAFATLPRIVYEFQNRDIIADFYADAVDYETTKKRVREWVLKNRDNFHYRN